MEKGGRERKEESLVQRRGTLTPGGKEEGRKEGGGAVGHCRTYCGAMLLREWEHIS